MRSSYALTTVITTICVTILTFGLITSMDHSRKDLIVGIVLALLLFAFAILLSVRTARQSKDPVNQ